MTASSMEYVRTDSHRVLQPVFLATTMILAAEVVYLIVWGLMLFPGGSLVGKLAWALTCSVGMGAIVGIRFK